MKTDIELAEAAGFELLMDGRISHMAIEKGDCDQEVRALIRLMREELVAVVAAERERCEKLCEASPLQLAADFGMTVTFDTDVGAVYVSACGSDVAVMEWFEGDQYAATKQAIQRAAAAINAWKSAMRHGAA